MGVAASKAGVRKTPVRYVAKPVFRTPEEIEAEFMRASATIKGVNKAHDPASRMGPQPWMDEKGTQNFMEKGSRSAPKWWLNTWMELLDQGKEDKIIVSGSLPMSWERDKHEPYSLVRNRVDHVDLKWILEEGKDMPLDELFQHTKLERKALEDILATVEMPKMQYRNYKGKITKTVDDTNTHLSQRQEEIKKSRELELLRRIGYTDEELAKEDQYITNRSRGVQMLDDLGASVKDKQRRDRKDAARIDITAKSRARISAIERGEYVPSSEELAMKPKLFLEKTKFRSLTRTMPNFEDYDRDLGNGGEEKMQEWIDIRKRWPRPPDTVEGVPVLFGTTKPQVVADPSKPGQESENAPTVLSGENIFNSWDKFTTENSPKGAPGSPTTPPKPPTAPP